MSPPPEITTPRLRLRPWQDRDRAPFAALNADPEVMEWMPAVLTRAESDAAVDRYVQHFATHGFGFWVVEVPDVTPFAGFVGLAVPTFLAHFTPCVEIGWRLARDHWGRGYATEAGRAALQFAFTELDLDEVVSFTPRQNRRSRAVMERLGLRHDPVDDFVHPGLAEDHPLQPLVLYCTPRDARSRA
ncbi:MAG: GNAT family N-acetyltransferase [Planctomycetota bacterium]